MRYIKLLFASVILVSMSACVTDNQSDLDMMGYVKTINIVGPEEIAFEQIDGSAQTKATSVSNGGALVFNWAVGDTLGIFPNKGNQVEFPITAQEGSTSASFDGGGWALRNNASYAAYYPFSVWNYFRNNQAVILDYSGQVQDGNGSFDHLSAYDYLASAKTTPKNSTVTFQMDRQGSILYIDIVVPEPATITSLTISCNEAIFVEKAALDISGNNPVVTPIETKESLTLTFENTTTTEQNETVRAYMAVQPVDFSSKTVTATLVTDADTYTAPVVSRVVNKGKAAFLRFSDSFTDGTNDPTTPPDNEIWYTSTDGNIVLPYKSDVFGATIVSNTYQDGKGVIRFDGPVTTIGYSAFANCNYLRTVELPASVTTIGGSAFFQCYSLSNVSLPEGLTRIEANAFLACKKLSDITLPETLVYIGTDAFLYCSSLTTVHIPESVTSLWSAFTGCSSLASFTGKYASADGRCQIRDNMMVGFAPAGLTTYTVPANVTVIYNEVFRSCKLEEVILPEGLKELYSAFFYCDNLKSLVIPSTVNELKGWILDSCPALTEVVILATVPPTCYSDELFPDTNNCPIYVPAESVNAYKTAEHWSVYADRIQAIPDSTVPEAVDLGLTSGLKWATCNVGANAPEDYGDYFAWGGTAPQERYYWRTCPFRTSGYSWGTVKFSKYNTSSDYGPIDNNTVLDPEDDAATVNWGGSWRMPTNEEWQELLDECTWTWTTQNGVEGRLVTSNTNGNSIFLPAAGYRDDTSLDFAGSDGVYWSSSLSTDYPDDAYGVDFFSDDCVWYHPNRYEGLSVRPVTDEGVRVSVIGVSLNENSLSLSEGGTASITATVIPSNATQPNVIWSSNNTSVAAVDYTGKVTAVAAGTAIITAKTYDGGFTATCLVTVVAPGGGNEGTTEEAWN